MVIIMDVILFIYVDNAILPHKYLLVSQTIGLNDLKSLILSTVAVVPST